MSEYENLTRYIPLLENDSLGEWIIDRENDGSPEHPIQLPFVNYSHIVNPFVDDVYEFCEAHPEYQHTRYGETLKNHSVQWGIDSMSEADISSADATFVIALIVGAIRAERFCDGALLTFLSNGSIVRWLKRLKAIDELH